jgi:hypothetical protein
MKTVDIEKLNQLISRTDINGNDKVRWLTDFIDGREFEQQERSYIKLIEELELRKSKQMNTYFKEFYSETIELIKQFKKK